MRPEPKHTQLSLRGPSRRPVDVRILHQKRPCVHPWNMVWALCPSFAFFGGAAVGISKFPSHRDLGR